MGLMKQKVKLDSQTKQALKKYLVYLICQKFKLTKEKEGSLIERLLMYFLARFSTTAGDSLVRLKERQGEFPKLKKYNPKRKSDIYSEQYLSVSILTFGHWPTQRGLINSLRESITEDGVMDPFGRKKVIPLTDLEYFEIRYKTLMSIIFNQ